MPTSVETVAVMPSTTGMPTGQSLTAASPSDEPPAAEPMATESPGTAAPTKTRTPAGSARAGAAQLSGVTHVWQKWNNCGPATVLMALSAFGVPLEQQAVAAELKPDREDTNVTPEEIAAFARAHGFQALARVNGDREVVRDLVAAGVPVMAEQWIDVEGRGEMGHYRVVIGFDDATGDFVTQDSYYGPNRRYGYDAFERMWRPFLGAYVVAYRPEDEAAVRAIVGADWADGEMWRRALDRAEAWTAAEPDAGWAWFALGQARSNTGDHAGAADAFERAIAIGLPYRAFWYQFGYYRALYATGAYDRLVAHADATLESMGGENLEESHYWRGLALRRLGRAADAEVSLRAALTFNPRYTPAQEALDGAEPDLD